MDRDLLFEPFRAGALQLSNRVVMAPMTRMRTGTGGVPTALNAEYYAQRASAGLIVSEATAVSEAARGYPVMPGLWTAEQARGWSDVADAVHREGGVMALQLVHHGRRSHSSYSPLGARPVAPSEIASPERAYTTEWAAVASEVPRALEAAELPEIVESFRVAAARAVEAGMDAVEIHGANGFLLDQFLQDGTNHRDDDHGGSVENRSRLLLDVVDAVATSVGADRVAVRLSPYGGLGGITDTDTFTDFDHVVRRLSERRIAYLHLVQPRAASVGYGDDLDVDSADNAQLFGPAFDGLVIAAGGYTADAAASAIADGRVGAVAFGRMYIANPDLVERFRLHEELNAFDRATAYGGGAAGYLDYPSLTTHPRTAR